MAGDFGEFGFEALGAEGYSDAKEAQELQSIFSNPHRNPGIGPIGAPEFQGWAPSKSAASEGATLAAKLETALQTTTHEDLEDWWVNPDGSGLTDFTPTKCYETSYTAPLEKGPAQRPHGSSVGGL